MKPTFVTYNQVIISNTIVKQMYYGGYEDLSNLMLLQ